MDSLITDRLVLRPLVSQDVDDLARLYAQPILMQYITGHSLSYEQVRDGLRQHIMKHEQYGFGFCAVILKANGAFIGRGGLKPGESPNGITGELSWLLSTAYWGRGLATELGQVSIEYGVMNLRLARIFATAYRANQASVRVMEKLGMRLVRADDDEVEYEVNLPSEGL
jgi:ribosomal-protein-alanine N-acetyltransferase